MEDARLYILMRTDLASMNPGKGMAQAAHAANAAVNAYRMERAMLVRTPEQEQPEWFDPFGDWTDQSPQGFGTTITLAVPTEDDMTKLALTADALGYLAGVVHDPSYPVRDGEVTHLLPIDTCAYVFSPDGTPWFLSTLSLHP